MQVFVASVTQQDQTANQRRESKCKSKSILNYI